MKCLLVVVVFGIFGCALTEKIDPEIYEKLKKSDTTNVIVKFVGANIDESYALLDALGILIDRTGLLNNMVKIFKKQADLVQKPVLEALKSLGIEVKSNQLWITGELVLYACNKVCIEALAINPAVESVTAEKFLKISVNRQVSRLPPQWGVDKINAPYAWETYKSEGEDVVVGIIDTGVLHTHEALQKNYRGWKGEGIPAEHDYSWLDAGSIEEKGILSKIPLDENGHGTHVTGTICGNAHIGVAPKAKWIACKGSADGTRSLSNHGLLLCGQFMLCPTDVNNENEDCSKAPHVINSSWGSPGGSRWYDAMVRGWKRAGIVSFFSAGNDGNKCGNVLSPADGKDIIAVGSTDEEDRISDFSSMGPSKEGVIKPDFSAPGSNILSAWPTGYNRYMILSGTSMASPHAAGTAALIVGYFKKNNLQYTVDDVINALKDGVQPTQPTMETCNGIRDDVYPNNFVGLGRISAQASLSKDVISKYGSKSLLKDITSKTAILKDVKSVYSVWDL